MRVRLYLKDISQVSSADFRVLRGVERDRSYSDEGKDAGFRIPPQHYPWTIFCLTVEDHLMGSWQSLGSCENRRITIMCE